jgi:hypothetical protein
MSDQTMQPTTQDAAAPGHFDRTGQYVAPPPPPRSLAKATAVAIVLAAIVLVTAVLPAEYGIDPLGTGRALGLDKLFAAGQEAAAAASAPATIAAAEGGPVFPQFADYRVDTREFTIDPGQGMEFKYELDKGATMIYSWKATQYVDFDFHTEPEGKPSSASDSFEKGEAAQKRGGYTAPYGGIHGWYWENKTDRPVKVTLTTAGFYDEAMLFMPKQAPLAIEIPERPAAQ